MCLCVWVWHGFLTFLEATCSLNQAVCVLGLWSLRLFLLRRYYRLLVEVRSNSEATSAAQANVTIVVLPVPHPPLFNDTIYSRDVYALCWSLRASAVFLSSPHHKRFLLMGPCMQDSPVTFGFLVDCSRFENTTVGGDISPCLVAYDPDVEPVSFSIVNTVTYTGLVNVTSAGTRIDLRLKRFCFGLFVQRVPTPVLSPPSPCQAVSLSPSSFSTTSSDS
jgi:hypothetical protein